MKHDPVRDLILKREALLTQSQCPAGFEQPADVLYWSKDRLEHNRAVFDEMNRISELHGLTEISSPYSGEVVVLPEFYTLVERSIEYSDRINRRL